MDTIALFLELLTQAKSLILFADLQAVQAIPTFPDGPNPIDNTVNFARDLSEAFAINSFGGLGEFAALAWRAMAIVYIAFLGWQVLFTGRFDIASIGSALLRITIILVAVTQLAFFSRVFIRIFFDVPDELGGFLVRDLSGSLSSASVDPSTEGISSALGTFWSTGFNLASDIMALETTGIFGSFGLLLPAGGIMIATILLCVAAAIILVLAYLALGIFLGTAPFFILLAMFQSTRPLFEGWLRMMMNYALVPLFVYATISMAFFIAQPAFMNVANELQMIGALSSSEGFLNLGTSDQQEAANNFNIWGSVAALLFAGIVATVLMTQVVQMAAGVAGGFALATGRLVSRALTPARNLGRNLANRTPGIGQHARRQVNERRELRYLQRTQGLQRQLASARGGNAGLPPPQSGAAQPSGSRAPAGTTGAGTPTGAAAAPSGGNS